MVDDVASIVRSSLRLKTVPRQALLIIAKSSGSE